MISSASGVLPLIVEDLLLEIAEVVAQLHIMVAGDQTALHEPGLHPRRRHEAQGIGGQDPLQIGGDIVPLDGQHIFIAELSGNRHEGLPWEVGDRAPRVADVAKPAVMMSAEKRPAKRISCRRAAPDGHRALLLEAHWVVKKEIVALLIELHQDRIGIMIGYRPTLHNSRHLGDFSDVTEQIRQTEIGIIVAGKFPQIEEICTIVERYFSNARCIQGKYEIILQLVVIVDAMNYFT